MKFLLVKFGNAVQAIRQDGVFKGGRRVLQAGSSLFSPVHPADVLFIAGGVGDAARYNCHHQAEELELQGIRCGVTVQNNLRLPSYADSFQIFIFHRTMVTPKVRKLTERIKQQKKEIIFATDDLVFDPQYFKYMNFLENANRFERMMYEKGVGREILTDPYVTTAVTTTSFLKEKLSAYGKQVFISKNKLSKKDVEICDKLMSLKEKRNDDIVKIGYFSGTISHNEDFATISNVLVKILKKYSNVRLVLVGHLDAVTALVSVQDQVEVLPFVTREKHFENIADIDINIAPLERDNPFCEAKSELKFFEAGIVGVPTVSSATQTFREAIEDGTDGFIADNDQQWEEKLIRLITDEPLRDIMGTNARRKVLAQYTTTGKGNEAYYAYLKKIINGS